MKYNFKALPTDPWEGVRFAQDVSMPTDSDMGGGGDMGDEEPDDMFAGDNLTIGSDGESEVAMDLLGLGQNVGDTYNEQAALDRESAVRSAEPLTPESDPKYVPASQKKKAVFPTFNTGPDEEGPYGDRPNFNPDAPSDDDEDRGPYLDEAEPGNSEYPMSDDPTMTERWDKPDLGGGFDEYEYEERLNDDPEEDDLGLPGRREPYLDRG